MNNRINITKVDGTVVQADIICLLENIQSGSKYAYYTLNEIIGAGTNSTVKIYVSKEMTGEPAKDLPITDQEWQELKGYMAESLKDVKNPNVLYLPIQETFTSVSDKAIAMPVNYDYVNKQRNLYMDEVNKAVQTPEPVTTSVEPAIEPVPVEPVAPAIEEVQAVPELQPIAPTITEEVNITPEVVTPVAVEPVITPEIIPIEEQPVVPEVTPVAPVNDNPGTVLQKIDLAEIEDKYAQMFDELEQLKEHELEAARRYNATIELSEMHIEQHASYVANEQTKEAPQPMVEPTPVVPEPIISNPAPTTSVETNWFDMPESTI